MQKNKKIKKIEDLDKKSFDSVIPKDIQKIRSNKKRIVYKTKANSIQIIELNSKNKKLLLIFNIFINSIDSNWFESLGDHSKCTYYYAIHKFIDWLNDTKYIVNKNNEYTIFKDFEIYRMNNDGLKLSPLKYLNKLFNQGMVVSSINNDEYSYMKTLVSLTKPSKSEPPVSYTLNNWFNLSWIREFIGEEKYLSLESPKILMNSFRISISLTLLWLLEKRSEWKEVPYYEVETIGTWYYSWNRKLIELVGEFDVNGEPKNEFTEFLVSDLVLEKYREDFRLFIKASGSSSITKRLHGLGFYPWKPPIFFRPENFSNYSEVEELLCAWLLASEAIQPSDIKNLTTFNFSRERNKQGKLLALQCTYFKGRSGSFKETYVLSGKDCWAQAIDHYIEGLVSNSLFNTDIQKCDRYPVTSNKSTKIGFIYSIWRDITFKSKLEVYLKKYNSISIFIDAMLVFDISTESYSIYRKRHKLNTTYGDYRKNALNPLPSTIFSLTHLKTTAVHSRSDKYRESDLVNYNSHTSKTEKLSYLTDQNKDWVNQMGRITRLIINDLHNTVYLPSISKLLESVSSIELKTKISSAMANDNIEIFSIESITRDFFEKDQIIVIDNIDTSIFFIHFIDQVEKNINSLCRIRPDFVEKNIIVNIEWMTRMLLRLKSTSEAMKEYKKIKHHLPNIFDFFMETTI